MPHAPAHSFFSLLSFLLLFIPYLNLPTLSGIFQIILDLCVERTILETAEPFFQVLCCVVSPKELIVVAHGFHDKSFLRGNLLDIAHEAIEEIASRSGIDAHVVSVVRNEQTVQHNLLTKLQDFFVIRQIGWLE